MIRTKLLASLAMTCFLVSSASADIITDINLTNLEGDASFATDMGTAGAITDTGFGTSRTFTYEVTGLDLAGDGTTNDSVIFSLNLGSTSGVAGAGVAVTNAGNAEASFGVGTNPNFGNFDVNEIDAGETLTLTSLAPVVTLGDGQTLLSSTFNGFTGLESFFVNGDANNNTLDRSNRW